MSVEKALEDLAEAVRENSEILKSMTAAAKASVSGKATTAASSKSKDEDGDDEKPKRTRTTKVKVPTAKEIGAKTSAYLEVDDEDEYEARKAIIKKIVGKFDAAKMSEIEEEFRVEAMELLEIAISGKNPFPKSRRDDDDVA